MWVVHLLTIVEGTRMVLMCKQGLWVRVGPTIIKPSCKTFIFSTYFLCFDGGLDMAAACFSAWELCFLSLINFPPRMFTICWCVFTWGQAYCWDHPSELSSFSHSHALFLPTRRFQHASWFMVSWVPTNKDRPNDYFPSKLWWSNIILFSIFKF